MLLSICIPSYNRFEKLNETISNIMQAESDDFEVVIIDNCSPRDINEYISNEDKRLRIVKREQPVYGAKNVGDSVLFGKGKYSLLLLDKDNIVGNDLDAFIETLRSNDVCGGYCELNSNNNVIEIESKRSIENFGFLSKHPSGDFYKMDILKDYIKEKDDELEKDPFPFDIYLAYCASKGSMMHYDKPVVCSRLNDPNAEDTTGTLTFKKELGNLYYFPKNRNDQFTVYTKCLSEFDISREKKLKVLYYIYKRSIKQVSIEYRMVMKNPVVCRHYGHEPENITILKMLKNIMALRKVYYATECSDVTKKEKKKIERAILRKIAKKVVNKIKRKIFGSKEV